MIIQQVVIQNFGLYKGEHTVNLENVDPSRVITLIGGLNGRGKTTFLDAIILGLYGRRALKYLQDERIGYAAYIENHVSKGIPAGSQTRIQLTLCESNAEGDRITICRSWDKNLVGISDETLVAYRNGHRDESLSGNWDYFVEEILPLTISRFFFFDNEKIAQIADDESFESVKDAIRALLGFTTIDQLISDMGKLSKKFSQKIAEDDQPGLMRELEEIEQAIEDVQAKADAARADAQGCDAKIKELRELREQENERFWQNGGNLALERHKLEEEKKAVTEAVAQYTNMARDYSQNASTPLLLCKPLLENISRQQADNERQRTGHYYNMFIARLKEQLAESADYPAEFATGMTALLENISSEFQSGVNETAAAKILPADTLGLIQDVLTEANQKRMDISALLDDLVEGTERLEQIESHLSREINESETQQARRAMMEISDQIISLEVDKRMADERLAQYEKEKNRLSAQKTRTISESLKVQLGNSEADRIIKYANIVIRTMELFKQNLLEQKLQELSDRILACFMSMVKKNSMIRDITIDPATLDIKLVDYTGGELLKAQLSAGEKQLFAISIIWGLAQCSGYDMPVIIDTPLGRLDSQHRTSFLEGYLPYAGRQVVVLSTDEEIYGKYYDLIRPYVGREYTLVYNEEMKSTSIESGYLWGDRDDHEAD